MYNTLWENIITCHNSHICTYTYSYVLVAMNGWNIYIVIIFVYVLPSSKRFVTYYY